MKTADAVRLAQAIQERRVVAFRYKDVERTVHPHIIGVTGEQHVALSGWQTAGTGRGWRLYHLADLRRLTVTDRFFHSQAPGYNPHDPAFSEIIVRL